MRVLVFGKTGQVATELAAFDGVTCLSRAEADLGDPQACADAIAGTQAGAVINAAAYTAVDRAEEDRETAFVVNARAPAAMAQAAAARGLPFVHISTDYVFDGSGTVPWQPGDTPRPLGVYGASKLEGERGVAGAGGVYAILRTSWVFSAHGGNFVKTMLRLGVERDALNIVSDQIGGPTAARDIAQAVMRMAGTLSKEAAASGIYHLSGAPDVSWAGFAREIFAQADLQVTVNNIPTSAYPTPAERPLNSRLDCASTLATFGLTRPDWRRGLAAVLSASNRT